MKQLAKTEFKILDNNKFGGATQIEINVSDNEGRGSAIVDFWGPNKKKECTVLIKKSMDSDIFVKIIAKKIIQPILDGIISGKTYESLLNTSEEKIKSENIITTNKCKTCEKVFKSEKYLKVHIIRIHTETKKNCDFCDYTDNNRIQLRKHMRSNHTESTEPSVQEETINDLVDTTLEDEKMDTSKPFYEMKEDEEHHKAESLGDLRDQNIRMKQKQIEEEELKLTITKDEDKEAPKKRKSSKKKKINKKRQKKSKENVENIILPEKFRKIPDNIINLVKPGDIILNANPNGACGPNAAAAHIFEDQNEGPELRKAMNDHITKYWSHYQTKIDFPYEREVGNTGDKVYFKASKYLLDFLSNDERATYLWSDYEELHAISNLYQIKIKVISLASPDSIPVVNMIGPEPELAPFANLPAGKHSKTKLRHSEKIMRT